MSYTAEEFKSVLESAVAEANKNERYFYMFDLWNEPESYVRTPLEIAPGVTTQLIDYNDLDYSEDYTRGENVWNVFEIRYPDGSSQYFRRDGIHRSWDGGEWEDLCEVYPRQQTITVFE